MTTAKIFHHGGSQAVRLPKAFRFDATEVVIEKRGDEVVLRSKVSPEFKTLNDVARYMSAEFPGSAEFPEVPRPKNHERDTLTW